MSAKVVGIIPARFGSTRLPGKPLLPILGKTLLQRTYESARSATALDQLIVATDDERIFAHVKGFGGEVVMTSPDCPTGTDRLAEVVKKYPELKAASVIVNIQGDEPCIDPVAINRAIEVLKQDSQAVMSTIITPLTCKEDALSTAIVKCVIDLNQNALYFSRTLIPSNKRGEFVPSQKYYRHLGLYTYRPDFLLIYPTLPQTPLQMAEDLEQLKVLEHGYRMKVALVDCVSPGVDLPEDIQKVEQWICKQSTSSSPAGSVLR